MTTDGDDDSGRERPQLDLVQIAAGALAAITAALVGSRLGVNGTIAGAAVGSIVGAIGSATYADFLARTATRVRTVAVRPTGDEHHGPASRGDTAVLVDDRTYRPAQHRRPHDMSPPPAEPMAPQWQPPATTKRAVAAAHRSRRRGPLRRLMIGIVATFVVTLAVVTGFELLTGRTLSSLTGGGTEGGTSVGNVVRPDPVQTSPAEVPSPDPSVTREEPTPTTSTVSPSATVQPSTTAPTSSPSTSSPTTPSATSSSPTGSP